jgi:hypothetical protein
VLTVDLCQNKFLLILATQLVGGASVETALGQTQYLVRQVGWASILNESVTQA